MANNHHGRMAKGEQSEDPTLRSPKGVGLYISASRRDHDVRAPHTHIYMFGSVCKSERKPMEDTLGSSAVHEKIKSTKEPKERNRVTMEVFADLLDEQNGHCSHHIYGAILSEGHEVLHAMSLDTWRKLGEPNETHMSNKQREDQALYDSVEEINEGSGTAKIVCGRERTHEGCNHGFLKFSN